MHVFGLGKPNVEKMKEKRDVKGLIKALSYREDYYVIWQAIGALGEIRDNRAVEPLRGLLYSSDEDIRKVATWALGAIGDNRAVESLIKALNDSKPDVRKVAAWSLGTIKDTRAIEPLIKALNDYDEIRKVAIWALGNIGMPAVESLKGALSSYDTGVRERAAKALEDIGWRPGIDRIAAQYWIAMQKWDKCVEIGTLATEPLIRALEDPQLNIRMGAIEALAKIGDTCAVEPLINKLRDSARIEYAYALEKLGWKPGKDETAAQYWIAKGNFNNCVEIGIPALNPLIKYLNYCTYSNDKVQTVIETLVKIGPDAVDHLIQQALDNPAYTYIDSKCFIRFKSIEALGKIGDKLAVVPLITVLNHDVNEICCKAAAEALGTMGDARAVEPLINVLKNCEWRPGGWVKWELRKETARSLINLYKNNKIDQKTKNIILSTKDLITEPHIDKWNSNGRSSDCTDSHIDSGIGVDFPI